MLKIRGKRGTMHTHVRGQGSRRLVATVSVTAAALSLAMAGPVFSSAGASTSRTPAVPRAVVAYPGPGWRTVSPSTSITFRGLAPARLGAVRVVGSRSGLHRGRLVRSSDGSGATYRPSSPFRPGERVSVTSAVRVVGSTSTRFSFTVGTPGRREGPATRRGHRCGGEHRGRRGACGWGETVPSGAPQVPQPAGVPAGRRLVSHAARGIAPGLVLTTPNGTDDGQHGPTIYDNHGQLVWYRPMPYTRTWNLSVVTYRGARMLAVYVQGPRRRSGLARPQYLLLDRHYRIAARIPARNGYLADLHELQITSDGKAYLGAYHHVRGRVAPRDDRVRRAGGGHRIRGPAVRAASSSTMSRNQSQGLPPRPQGLPPMGLLPRQLDRAPPRRQSSSSSARNTATVYKISRATGRVLWRLGGKRTTSTSSAATPELAVLLPARRAQPGTRTHLRVRQRR